MATPRPPAPGFPGDYVLVDLEVKEAPLSEVAAQLERAVTRGLEGTGDRQEKGIEIVVHDSARDIKVTARAFKWPAGELLNMLLDQAGLTYTRERGAVGPAGLVKIHLVPRPEVSVPGGAGLPEWLGPLISGIAMNLPKEGMPDTSQIYIGGPEGLKALENLKVLGLERCPKCNEVVLLPGCNYCPKCGAKLPEKSKPEAKPTPTAAPKPEAQKKS
jgi:ssDNA-binding Zn-finger/Zn-ribbon topoisomerase 1